MGVCDGTVPIAATVRATDKAAQPRDGRIQSCSADFRMRLLATASTTERRELTCSIYVHRPKVLACSSYRSTCRVR